MTTETIDTLVVDVLLDDHEFRQGIRKIMAGTGQARKEAKSLDASFKEVAKSAAGLFGLLTGSSSLVKFIANVTEGSAALDRMAQNIGTTTESISAWSGAVEQAGGDSKAAQSSLDGLSKAMTEILVTGNSGMLPYFRALGVDLIAAQRSGDPLSYTLLAISDGLQQISATQGRANAFNIGRMMGMDPDTVNLLLQGRKAVEGLLKRQQEIGLVTSSNARQASEMRRQWVELKQTATATGRELVAQLSPAIQLVLQGLQELMRHKAVVIGMLGAMAVGAIAAAGPWLAMAAGVTAVGTAIALLADDWYTWLTGGKAAFSDFYGFVAEKWHALMDTLTMEGLKKEWQRFKAWLHGGKEPAPKGAGKPVADEASQAAFLRGRAKGQGSKIAMDYFVSQGWTPAQAAGIVANLVTESGMNPNALGDRGRAYGIAQWHPDRQRNFRVWAGKDIRQASFEEQLAFVNHELTSGSEMSAGARLRGATNSREAAARVAKFYERPANIDTEMIRRANLAASFQLPPPLLSRPSTSTSETNIGQITVVTQATDANGIARDLRGALASQADTGMQ